MHLRRLAATVLISAASATVGVAAGPASSALADTLVVSWAGSPQANPGLLTITAFAASAITSISAQLVPAVGSPVLVTDLQLVTGTTDEWQVPSPLALPAVGTYSVLVTATDAGGGSVTDFPAGTLYYYVNQGVTLSATPDPFDYDHQTVSFSGAVTGIWPDGSPAPIAGEDVYIVDTSLAAEPTILATATTASDGTYQVDAVPVAGHFYQAQVDAHGTTFAGQSASELVTAVKAPVQLTAHVSATKILYEQGVTITGTLTYTPAGTSTSAPLANSTVEVFRYAPSVTYNQPYAKATTAPDGSYSITLPSVKEDLTLQVYAGGLPGDAVLDRVLQKAVVNLPKITAAMPISLSRFSTKVSPFGALTVKGCLKVTGMSYAPALPFQIEYAAKPTGPWTALTTHRRFGQPGCTGDASTAGFAGTAGVQLAWAYYRVVWAGSAQYQPTMTQAVLAGRYPTRITSLKVSATHVASSGHLTVSGHLWQYTHAWHSYGGRRVLIVLRPKGSKTWYWIVKVMTDSTGHFTARFKDPGSASWSAVYEGDSTHYASSGKVIHVTVSVGLTGAIRLRSIAPLHDLQTGLARIRFAIRQVNAIHT